LKIVKIIFKLGAEVEKMAEILLKNLNRSLRDTKGDFIENALKILIDSTYLLPAFKIVHVY